MDACERWDVTGIAGGSAVRREIRRHAAVVRRPGDRPRRGLFRSLAYLYAAYGMGSRTAEAELAACLGGRGAGAIPSPEVALGLARGFEDLAARPA